MAENQISTIGANLLREIRYCKLKNMVSLNDRERYCLALIIIGGGQKDYESLRDVIFEYKESFSGLSDRYLKYQAVKNTLNNLVKSRYLSERNDVFEIDPILKTGFLQQNPTIILKAIENVIQFRNEHILEFNTSVLENYLFDETSFPNPPYEIIENLKQGLQLYKIGAFDSVLVKCGKCVEEMLNELNSQYSIFDKQHNVRARIKKLRDNETVNKLKENIPPDQLRMFTDGISVIYRFRNIMGAHAGRGWGYDQAAASCLILSFYLTDLYLWNIKKDTFG